MLPEWSSLLTAFLVGLVGGVHCLGMCGGIVSSLNLNRNTSSSSPAWLMQACYNSGRIFSYTLAGGIMGGVGLLLVSGLPIQLAQKFLLGFAGIFMILLGAYLSGWWLLLSHVEHAGRWFWKRIEPLARRLLPLSSPKQAFKLGLLWGFLPCGLVYSMLIQAVGSGSLSGGALLMLSFALGTLPNLLLMGALAGAAARLLHSRSVKQAAGLVVMGFGVHALWRLF